MTENIQSNADGLELKKIAVWKIILLVTVTYSVYIPIWFLKQREALNGLNSDVKIGFRIFVFIIVLYALSLVLLFNSLISIMLPQSIFSYLSTSLHLETIENLIGIVAGILVLIQSFRVRRILFQNLYGSGKDVRFSGICTFFLTIYYLQYKINRL